MNNKIKVAINGFGRIGRLFFRDSFFRLGEKIDIVAVNDLFPAYTLMHLLDFDSAFGRFFKGKEGGGELFTMTKLPGETEFRKNYIPGKSVPLVECEEYIHIKYKGEEKIVKVFHKKDPKELPWNEFSVYDKTENAEIVVESTGVFRTRDKAILHKSSPVNNKVKAVIISAPAKSSDVKTVVYKVNHELASFDDEVISNSSCTTNCITPVIKVIVDRIVKKDFSKIKSIYFTTIHGYTNDQRIVDAPHTDLRRARAAAFNIIPTTTGADKAAVLVFPELKGKIKGHAVRVPVIDGSCTDFVFRLEGIEEELTLDKIKQMFVEASENELKDVLEASNDELVSSDIIGNSHSSIADLKNFHLMKDGNNYTLRILSWYDNEWGYSSRLGDLICSLYEK